MTRVWCNHGLNEAQEARLRSALAGHELELAPNTAPASETAEVFFGQTPLDLLRASPQARWVHVTSAGYTRYAGAAELFRERGIALTKSSEVYASPCAQHVLALMLAQCRQLATALDLQRTHRRWDVGAVRGRAQVLEGQRIALVGYGRIGERLAALLAPFGATVCGLRRAPRGDEGLPMHALGSAAGDEALAAADQVVNLLPAAPETERFFDAPRLGRLKPEAVFYNVGRGTTVDQEALEAALRAGRLHAAWLDVTDPEPLPPEHPLWQLPNCFITPHAAGGRQREGDVLLAHFLDNFARYVQGEPLIDSVRWP